MRKIVLPIIVTLLTIGLAYAVVHSNHFTQNYDHEMAGSDGTNYFLKALKFNCTQICTPDSLMVWVQFKGDLESPEFFNITFHPDVGGAIDEDAWLSGFDQQLFDASEVPTSGNEWLIEFNETSTIAANTPFWIAFQIQRDATATNGQVKMYWDNANPRNSPGWAIISTVSTDWAFRAYDSPYFEFNVTYGAPAPETTATFVPPTPDNATRNNTQQIINITCAAGLADLWFDTVTPPVNQVLDEVPIPANFTTNGTADDTYYFVASCDNGTTNTTIRQWTLDTTQPTFTVNPSNGFSSDNITTDRYSNILPLNLSIADNIDLFAFQINITYNGDVYYNVTNESLSGTAYDFIRDVDVTTWPGAEYLVTLWASDSHTQREILPYGVVKGNKKLEFTTPEGNIISIESQGNSATNAHKKHDRYEFDFDFGDGETKQRVFHIKSDKPIIYRPNSGYKGHFVIYNPATRSGNWIDLEGIGQEISVQKIQDDHYKITIEKVKSHVQGRSIGGLNTNTESFIYQKSNLTIHSAVILPQSPLLQEDLLGYCNATDALDGNVVFEWEWFNDSISHSSYNVTEDFCYQEFANETTTCGGLDTGLYSCFGTFQAANPCELALDGNHSSAQAFCQGQCIITFNYTIPSGTQGAIWTVSDLGGTTNYTLPQACFNNSPDVLHLDALLNLAPDFTQFRCYTSDNDTVTLRSTSSNAVIEESIEWFPINPFFPSTILSLVDTIPTSSTQVGDNWTFSCRAYSDGNFTEWLNSSVATVLEAAIRPCDTGIFIFPVLNMSYTDEITTQAITVQNGYNLLFDDGTFEFNVTGEFNGNATDGLCTNVNNSLNIVNFTYYGSFLLKKDNYASKFFQITEDLLGTTDNDNPDFLQFSLIPLNGSSTVLYNWFTTGLHSVDGTMQIFKCEGNGTQNLIDSIPIVDSVATGNIELLNTPYAYSVIIGGTTYTDETSFSKCHVESQTEITYYVNIIDVDVAPALGLYFIDCNMTKSSNTSILMTWGTNSQDTSAITGCIFAYYQGISGLDLIQQNCTSTSFSLAVSNLPENNNYYVEGKLFQSGFSIQCDEHISFFAGSDTAESFGLTAVFALVIMIGSLWLLYASRGEAGLIFAALGLIFAWMLGIVNLSWVMVTPILFFLAAIVYIGRVVIKSG